MDLAVVARRIQCGQGFGQKKEKKTEFLINMILVVVLFYISV